MIPIRVGKSLQNVVMFWGCLWGLAFAPGQWMLAQNVDDSFGKEIAPILVRNCLACHGGDTVEGGWDIQLIQGIFQSGDSGLASVVPGAAAESELLHRMRTDDESLRMPSGGPPMTEEEIQSIENWIAQGALTDDPNQSESATRLLVDAVKLRPKMVSAPTVYPGPMAIISLALYQPTGASSEGLETILITGGYGELLIWHAASGKLLNRLDGFGPMIGAIEIADRNWVVSHGVPGEVGAVSRLTIAPADGSGAEGIRIVSRVDLNISTDVQNAIAVDESGGHVAIGFHDGTIEVYDLALGQREHRLNLHADAVVDTAWSRDEGVLLTASRDRTGKGVDMQDERTRGSYANHERALLGIGSTRSGPITLDETGTLRLWSSEGSNEKSSRGGIRGAYLPCVCSKDWIFVATGNQIHRVRVEWEEVEDGKNDKGDVKKKRVPRWQESPALETDAEETIASFIVTPLGMVIAGTQAGRVYEWTNGFLQDNVHHSHSFVALPLAGRTDQ